MSDQYFKSAHGVKIDKARAIQELRKHGITENDEFLKAVKPDAQGNYSAQSVLKWLGY